MNKRLFGATLLILAGFGLAGPPPVRAAIASSLDQPDTSVASNTVIEIISHDGGIWMATGQGLNFSLDGGLTWLLYNSTNGLNADNISALFSLGPRLWVATAHSEVVGGADITYSDTLMYTDDDGQNFHTVDLTSATRLVPEAFGAQRVIYDITGANALGTDWVFFTAWAGGFVGSRDGGQTWRRFHPSVSDSLRFWNFYNVPDSPTLPNYLLFFSCAADNGHGDSLYVWSGTAGGVFQYVFAPKYEKPSSNYITSIVYCNECGTGDSSRVFIGGENGVTRGTHKGAPFISAFTTDGLPGPFISTQFAVDGKLFVGTRESRDGNSTGLGLSEDGGETFSDISDPAFVGVNRTISSMAMMRDRMYLAAEEAGLFVSSDTGQTWTHLWVDTTDTSTANRRNVVWALDPLADTLRIGTDSGLVTWYLDPAGNLDSLRDTVFAEKPYESSTRVIKIRTQVFTDTLGQFDSLAVWTINRPVTDSGANVVKRGHYVEVFPGTWLWEYENFQKQVKTNDIAFIGDSVFAVGEAGLRYSYDGTNPSIIYVVTDSTSSDRLDNDTITVMSVLGDTVFIGTNRGFAISNNRGQKYRIFRPNLDSLIPDLVINHTFLSSAGAISGNWIPAMGLQDRPGELYPRIWLSDRPTGAFENEGTGITVGIYEPVDTTAGARYDLKWHEMDSLRFAWNFAFNGDSVFTATDTGLFLNASGTPYAWQYIPLNDVNGKTLVEPGTPVYAAEVIGQYMWVGTDLATVRLRLDNLLADTILYYVDTKTAADEVYAFPVPYRQSDGGSVDFHFTLDKAAGVTIEIYDAAMNLVSRVMDNRELAAGIYQGRNTGVPTWDGRNGKGDKVAVGMYYFKVEYSTGEVRWGKLAVIP